MLATPGRGVAQVLAVNCGVRVLLFDVSEEVRRTPHARARAQELWAVRGHGARAHVRAHLAVPHLP